MQRENRKLFPFTVYDLEKNRGESSKFPKSWSFEILILKLAVCLQNINISSLIGYLSLFKLYIYQETKAGDKNI